MDEAIRYEALIVELTTRPKTELLIIMSINKAEAIGRSLNAQIRLACKTSGYCSSSPYMVNTKLTVNETLKPLII